GDRPRERTLRKADLSEALKEATKEVHTQAENVEFLKNFQKGQVSRNGFKLVMSSLYHIYRALEEEIERHKAHPAYAPIYFPEELHRLSALTVIITDVSFHHLFISIFFLWYLLIPASSIGGCLSL
uniref:Heme oxygenase 1 n=1 Tax=Ornithorhynchus anatinus TaxID=9258 RepID=A0A6I8NV30_ORNAN